MEINDLISLIFLTPVAQRYEQSTKNNCDHFVSEALTFFLSFLSSFLLLLLFFFFPTVQNEKLVNSTDKE